MTLQGFLAKYSPLLAPEGGSGGGAATEQGPSSGGNSTSSGSSPSPAPSGASSASSDTNSGSPPSTPSPATSPSPGSEPSGGDPPSSFDFSSIFVDPGMDSPVVVPPTGVQPEVKPVVPPVGAEPPKPAPQATPPVVQPEVAPVQPGTQPQTPVVPEEQRPHFDPADPIALARGLSENKVAAIEHLAKGMFALTKEDLEALETNVAEAIPRLLARSVVEAQTQMFATLGRIVPLMIQRQNAVTMRHDTAENKFYDAWKDRGIDRAKHGDLVKRVAATVRSLNPDMPTDQIIQEVGPMVIAMAKIAPSVAAAPPTPASGANGSRPVQPFVPVQSGGTVVGSQPADEGGQFGYLGQHE